MNSRSIYISTELQIRNLYNRRRKWQLANSVKIRPLEHQIDLIWFLTNCWLGNCRNNLSELNFPLLEQIGVSKIEDVDPMWHTSSLQLTEPLGRNLDTAVPSPVRCLFLCTLPLALAANLLSLLPFLCSEVFCLYREYPQESFLLEVLHWQSRPSPTPSHLPVCHLSWANTFSCYWSPDWGVYWSGA